MLDQIEPEATSAGCRAHANCTSSKDTCDRSWLSRRQTRSATRRIRLRPVRLLVLAMMALAAIPSSAAASVLPEQGIYYGCSQNCEAGLDAARAAGLSFVIAPPSAFMAAALQARGMSAFWNVSYRTPRPDLVKEFASNPTTRGWYVADEPAREDAGTARWWTQQIHAIDPTHPTLSVHFGCSWGQAAEAMRPFKDVADWLGTDCYPIGPASSRLTGPSFAGGADVARDYRKTFWAVTQAASWAQMCGQACGRPETNWPSPREMQIMRDCAAAAGARVIAWYSLNTVLSGGDRRVRDLATAIRSPQRGCPARGAASPRRSR